MELCSEGLCKTSQFSKYLEKAESSFHTDPNNVFFKGTSLTYMDAGLQTVYLNVMDYPRSLNEWLDQRFHGLQIDDIFKRMKLLDTCLWPKGKDTLIKFWKEELSSVQKTFDGVFIKHNVSVVSVLVK